MTGSPEDRREALCDLLAKLGRSLLQYLDEADPWTDAAHADAKTTLDRLAAGQQDSCREVSDLLLELHEPADFGTYPSEFASLHYLALDFLMSRMVADQLGVVAAADAAIAAYGRGAGLRTLNRVWEREAGHFEELRRLADRLRG